MTPTYIMTTVFNKSYLLDFTSGVTDVYRGQKVIGILIFG